MGYGTPATNVASGYAGIEIEDNGQAVSNTILGNFSCGYLSNTNLLTMRMTSNNAQIITMVETGVNSNVRMYGNSVVAVKTFSEF